MGFLKRAFGKRHQDSPDPEEQAFDQAWFSALKRFEIVAGLPGFDFNLKHPRTGEVMSPHAGLGETFHDWKSIQSAWDKRDLLFRVLLGTVGKSMTTWQIANVLVALRQPHQAVQVMEKNPVAAADLSKNPQYCEAYARALQYMQRPAEAIEWAQTAYAAAPDNRFVRVRLADILHMTGEHEKAHEICSLMMKMDTPSAMADTQAVFAELFSVETGVVPSPVMAITFMESLADESQRTEFWHLGEVEFYDSPYFRMHHAYELLRQKETPRAIAKLVALVGEMPWLREATINLLALLKGLDPDGEHLMPELRQQLAVRIEENGWTTENMTPMPIDL